MNIVSILSSGEGKPRPITDFFAPPPSSDISSEKSFLLNQDFLLKPEEHAGDSVPLAYSDSLDMLISDVLSGKGLTDHKIRTVVPLIESEGARFLSYLESNGVDFSYPLEILADSTKKIAMSSQIRALSGQFSYPEIDISLSLLGKNIKKEIIFVSSLPVFQNISPFMDSGISLTPRSGMTRGIPVLGAGSSILNAANSLFGNTSGQDLAETGLMASLSLLKTQNSGISRTLLNRIAINTENISANEVSFLEPEASPMPESGKGIDPSLAGSGASNDNRTGKWGRSQLSSIKSVLSTLEGSNLKNKISKALTDPIRKYTENLTNSLAGAASDLVSTIPSLGGALISDIYGALGSAVKSTVLDSIGLGSLYGYDSNGRRLLLSDSDENESISNAKRVGSEGLLSRLGLDKTSALIDNAISNLKNQINSTLGIPLEKSGGDFTSNSNRFSYWRFYSSGSVLGTYPGPSVRITTYKSDRGKERFWGYGDIQSIEARVDRFYDFYVTYPADLKKRGLPGFFGKKSHWEYAPTIGNATMPGNSEGLGQLSDPELIYKKQADNIVSVQELQYQADIEGLAGVTLETGEKYSLGSFGDVCLTSNLSPLSSLSMKIIEDERLSVRSWMEAYLDYMYKGVAYNWSYNPETGERPFTNSSSRYGASYNLNLNPNLCRPIYQGYYCIVFLMLDCFRKNVLRQKIYYAVPRFDLSMRPSNDIKVFEVTWDVIGEEGLSGDLSSFSQENGTLPTSYIK